MRPQVWRAMLRVNFCIQLFSCAYDSKFFNCISPVVFQIGCALWGIHLQNRYIWFSWLCRTMDYRALVCRKALTIVKTLPAPKQARTIYTILFHPLRFKNILETPIVHAVKLSFVTDVKPFLFVFQTCICFETLNRIILRSVIQLSLQLRMVNLKTLKCNTQVNNNSCVNHRTEHALAYRWQK